MLGSTLCSGFFRIVRHPEHHPTARGKTAVPKSGEVDKEERHSRHRACGGSRIMQVRPHCKPRSSTNSADPATSEMQLTTVCARHVAHKSLSIDHVGSRIL
jgi:hypothetical protein